MMGGDVTVTSEADRYKDWQLLVPSQFEALAKEHTFRKHWYTETEGAHFGVENFPQLLRPKDR
jgi:hypothetical protein